MTSSVCDPASILQETPGAARAPTSVRSFMDDRSSLFEQGFISPPLAFGLGWMEITIVILVVLLVFGNKLPGMARNLGRSFIEFKKGVKGADEEKRGDLQPGEDQEQIARESTQKERSKP